MVLLTKVYVKSSALLCLMLILFYTVQSHAYEWKGTAYFGTWTQQNKISGTRSIIVISSNSKSRWQSITASGPIITIADHSTGTCTLYHLQHKAFTRLKMNTETGQCQLVSNKAAAIQYSLLHLMNKPCIGLLSGKLIKNDILDNKPVQIWECTTHNKSMAKQWYRTDLGMVIKQELNNTVTRLVNYTANKNIIVPVFVESYSPVPAIEFAAVISNNIKTPTMTSRKQPALRNKITLTTSSDKVNYSGKPWADKKYTVVLNQETLSSMAIAMDKNKPYSSMSETEKKSFLHIMQAAKQDFTLNANGSFTTKFLGHVFKGQYRVKDQSLLLIFGRRARHRLKIKSDKQVTLQFMPNYRAMKYKDKRDPRVFTLVSKP